MAKLGILAWKLPEIAQIQDLVNVWSYEVGWYLIWTARTDFLLVFHIVYPSDKEKGLN